VALVPGTVPLGYRARIEARLGAREILMVNGGFDPVAIPAVSGDTVTVTVHDLASRVIAVYRDLIRPARRPIIVRTDPPPRKRDVPLNSRIQVIFSEPVDPSTVTTAIRLRTDSPVPGRVSLSVDGVSAEFEPDAALEPNTEYTLDVTAEVRDLSGDPLAEAVTVSFTTTSTPVIPSPLDGFSLAFARNGNTITVSTPDGVESRILFHSGGHPAWSPDGRTLAFQCVVPGSPGVDICRIDSDGGGFSLLTSGAWHDESPNWSPDGRQIAFFTRNCAIPDPWEGMTCDRPHLARMDADGSNLSTTHLHPAVGLAWDLAWSPDGTRFAFTCDTDICTLRSDGTGLTQLTFAPTVEKRPKWSPDGRQLVFQVANGTSTQHPYSIAVMDAAGGIPRRIGASVVGTDPTWSPDGSRILFTGYSAWSSSDRGMGQGIWMMNLDGTGLVRVTDKHDYEPVLRR
jgi:Tol biopolymer transport system component